MSTFKKILPAHISHPGKILFQELKERGWSQKKLAELIQKNPVEISYIINGKRGFSLEMALLIGEALGTGYEPRIGMQHMYDLIYIKNKHKHTLQHIHACI